MPKKKEQQYSHRITAENDNPKHNAGRTENDWTSPKLERDHFPGITDFVFRKESPLHGQILALIDNHRDQSSTRVFARCILRPIIGLLRCFARCTLMSASSS